MITFAAITLHNWLQKNSMYEKVYNSLNLCDSEVPQAGEITEGIWRSFFLNQKRSK